MNNSEFILEVFRQIHQDILESYQTENNQASVLKNHSDFEFFVRNRCPEWHRVLNLDDEYFLQYFDYSLLNHAMNVACFNFCLEKIQEMLSNE